MVPKATHGTQGEAASAQRRVGQWSPSTSCNAVLDASQEIVGPFGFQGALLARVPLAVDQNPQVPLCRAALQPLIPQSVCTPRVAVTQVQNLALALVKLHRVSDCPALQSVQIPLQGLSVLVSVNSSSQFCTISKLN